MVPEFDEQLKRFRAAAKDAASWADSAHSMYGGIAEQLDKCVGLLEDSRRMLELERELRITAERHKERFRYALWVYLQERDGLAGIHAPTRETLKLIRELVTDLGD